MLADVFRNLQVSWVHYGVYWLGKWIANVMVKTC